MRSPIGDERCKSFALIYRRKELHRRSAGQVFYILRLLYRRACLHENILYVLNMKYTKVLQLLLEFWKGRVHFDVDASDTQSLGGLVPDLKGATILAGSDCSNQG